MGDVTDSMSASFCGPSSESFGEAPLVPFIDLAFRLEPIVCVAPVPAMALMPQFVCSLGNLYLQTHIFVNMENWCGGFRSCCLFHIFKSLYGSRH
jgi:hypothetical protein